MLDAAPESRDPRELAEAARRAIVPSQLRRRGLGLLEPLLLDPELERAVAGGGPEPELALTIRERAVEYKMKTPADRAAIVCTAGARPVLAEFLLRSGVRLDVYSYGELPPELELRPAGIVRAAAQVP
jgi:flagellar biosynthesis component FlhA